MAPYSVGGDVGTLEDWAFDNPDSQYRIIKGAPRASGRLDGGGPGHQTRFGIWRCTIGTFECIEQGDELMTVLSGECTLVNHSNNSTTSLGPGDSLFIRDASHVTWCILQDLTKVFLGYKQNGY
ncbi:MAG: cupin domain-containing protein [Pseudomonadota bacterium]